MWIRTPHAHGILYHANHCTPDTRLSIIRYTPNALNNFVGRGERFSSRGDDNAYTRPRIKRGDLPSDFLNGAEQ